MKTRLSFVMTIAACVGQPQSGRNTSMSPAESSNWQIPARWHRVLKRAIPGTLLINDAGVEFQSPKFHERWAYIDIRSFALSPRELTLQSYQRRPWHEPGERNFRFTWSGLMPAEIATQLAERVGKPVRNGVPPPSTAAVSEIQAHHRMWSGGTNGTLRLKKSGIDYVTKDGRDSHAWRWADIQTIANPDPYSLRITGYREVVEFDLKQPIPRELFESMWDHLYTGALNLSPTGGSSRHASQEAQR